MHPMLLRVPNLLAYNNQIQCGYTPLTGKTFLNKEAPFLFIDVKGGHEQMAGTSFFNIVEADIVAGFAKYWLQHTTDFKEPKELSLFTITPYTAQRSLL